MIETVEALKSRPAEHAYLICIDSDGCAFDTMEVKHKECFIPNTIRYWGLQPIAKYAREAAEFVNLYSKWRGENRFPALIRTFDLLASHPKVLARRFTLPKATALREWIAAESKLGNPALEKYCAEHPAEDLQIALQWSKAINASVDEIVQGGLPPFPYVREFLEAAAPRADLMVCSQTPSAALRREWQEQGVAQHLFCIAGQEMGKKSEHIAYASAGRFDPNRILMIGDAPGDHEAAKKNGACFFPIMPGSEDESWKALYEEGLGRFLDGTFRGDYQDALLRRFESCLPERPPWQA
jgi:phosphoglycolate phosphatase-like HAD superfamily hydrolase